MLEGLLVKMNKQFENALVIGALVLTANFFGNVTYAALSDNNSYGKIRKEKEELLSAIGNTQSKLDLLSHIDCNSIKCLEVKLDLESAIRSLNRDMKNNDDRSEELAKIYQKSFESALVYG